MSAPDGANGLLVLAVDDEAPGLDELVHELTAHGEVQRVLTATESVEALRVLSGSSDAEVSQRLEGKRLPAVDAVFADINMPGLSGIELAKVVNSMTPVPKLVFVTGVADEAVTAFELGALDYLLKPVTADRLDRAIGRIQAARAIAPAAPAAEPATPANRDEEVIPVELGGSTKLIARSSVRWVEAQGDYARLHTQEGSHLVRIPLAQLEENWRGAGFVRIHRSYLVALPLVTELKMTSSGYTVIIGENEKELPVSRRHTRDLKDRLVPSARSNWRNSG